MSRIAALLTERAGYVSRGLPTRVAQVDAELARLGHHIETAVTMPPETAMQPRPSVRKAPAKRV